MPMNSIEVVRNGGGRIAEMEDILSYFGECFDAHSRGRSWALAKSTIGRIIIF